MNLDEKTFKDLKSLIDPINKILKLEEEILNLKYLIQEKDNAIKILTNKCKSQDSLISELKEKVSNLEIKKAKLKYQIKTIHESNKKRKSDKANEYLPQELSDNNIKKKGQKDTDNGLLKTHHLDVSTRKKQNENPTQKKHILKTQKQTISTPRSQENYHFSDETDDDSNDFSFDSPFDEEETIKEIHSEETQTVQKTQNIITEDSPQISISNSILPLPYYPTKVIKSLKNMKKNQIDDFINSILLSNFPSVFHASRNYSNILNNISVAIWAQSTSNQELENLIIFFIKFSHLIAPKAETRFFEEAKKDPNMNRIVMEIIKEKLL